MEQTMLVKAEKATAVRLELVGMDGIDTEQLPVHGILKLAGGIRPAGMLNPVFYRNLLRVDSNLPLIYTWLVYLFYRKEEKVQSLRSLERQLVRANALGFSEEWIYKDKLQRFLVETAFGMQAGEEWDGGHKQLVRGVHITKDGKCFRFSGAEREQFGQFLLENCEVYGNKKADGMENVYEKDGRQFVNLSLNIVI